MDILRINANGYKVLLDNTESQEISVVDLKKIDKYTSNTIERLNTLESRYCFDFLKFFYRKNWDTLDTKVKCGKYSIQIYKELTGIIFVGTFNCSDRLFKGLNWEVPWYDVKAINRNTDKDLKIYCRYREKRIAIYKELSKKYGWEIDIVNELVNGINCASIPTAKMEQLLLGIKNVSPSI